MRTVAERADVALGTLYRYFPSKTHLLVSALAREFSRTQERLPKVAIPGDTEPDGDGARASAAARTILSRLRAAAAPWRRSQCLEPEDIESIDDLASTMRGRHELGLSQVRLADRAKISPEWLSSMSEGNASVQLILVLRLVEALGLRLSLGPRPPAPYAGVDLDELLEEYRTR